MPEATPMESADPNPKPGFFGAIKEVYYEFANDDVMTQSAALAFYTGLALAPLLTLVVWSARVLLPSNKKLDVTAAFDQVMGPQAAAPIKQLLDPASHHAPSQMTVAGIVSIVILIFSASGVFGQVQSALNSIWHVEARPASGMMGFVRKRVLSLGMMASILFLLMASLVISTVLQFVFGNHNEPAVTIAGHFAQAVISIGLFTVLFAALFKFVPDAKIRWRPAWVGGFISAILFSIGKFALAIYLGRSGYENSYAAFGSFVVLLVWVYYSAVIVLIGAEATEVYARRQGHAVEPSKHAVRIIQETREV